MAIGHLRVTRLGIYDRLAMAKSIALKIGIDYRTAPSYFLELADKEIDEIEADLTSPCAIDDTMIIPGNRFLVITAIASLTLMIITLI